MFLLDRILPLAGVLAVLIVTSLLLVRCSDSTSYKHYNLPAINPTAEITFHEYKNIHEFQKEHGNRTGKAVWSPNDNRCDVYFVAGDLSTLGHEAYHCFKGAFHEE